MILQLFQLDPFGPTPVGFVICGQNYFPIIKKDNEESQKYIKLKQQQQNRQLTNYGNIY